MEEAIEVLCSRKTNRRTLASIGLNPSLEVSVEMRKAMMTSALASRQHFCCWQIAPSDNDARISLAKSGLLTCEDGSAEEVMSALRSLSAKSGGTNRKSYNAYIMDFLEITSSQDPSRRSRD
ncbi:unnamed protein product [Polarella glacialis]|uniref:Uncharacterized protein n=1 Tax=Polarella glacialis TaxID=89957 RepID=A0A813F2V3_POLGL|nr:unnamed protein product [Polarella glacialis]